MKIEDLINVIDEKIYQQLVTAIELGKWEDGTLLTQNQKEDSLQIIMLWQARHNEQAEHLTIGKNGKIHYKSKQELKQLFAEKIETEMKV